jgi:5-methyltetrahydropteroyltriglutamate--homocysteine methyltransferase
VLKPEQVTLDPDCGLKTRTWEEAEGKLAVLMAAVREVREELARATAKVS